MSVHVFGYGSLLWRPGFPSAPPRAAFVRDWQRRLDQGSPDHRGVPHQLGRVATLVPAPGAVCWGAVFELAGEDTDAVLAALDYRERGGYVRAEMDAWLRDGGGCVRAVTWVAAVDNPFYLGPASLEVMAEQVRRAVGPSGTNVEYVLRLAETLRALGIDDPHVFALEAAVRPHAAAHAV